MKTISTVAVQAAPQTRRLRIVGIGGTTRPGSSSEKAVREVLRRVEERGAHTVMFGGPELSALPHFAPESAERTPGQIAFVQAVREADGIVVGSPGYHAGISGLVKNALDLLEDLRDDERPYFEGRAVGCVVTAAGWQAGGVTLQALRAVVHAMRGWPTPLGLALNTAESQPFGPDGRCIDEKLSQAFDTLSAQVVRLARA